MQQKTIQLAVLFVASLTVLPAQQDRPPAVRGLSIPAVAGLPFSATLVIESERVSEDGLTEQGRTINIIARDARGRTRNEVRSMMPESFHGSPTLISVRLFDPETQMLTTCDMNKLSCRRDILPTTTSKSHRHKSRVQIADLGTSTMNGLEAKGTRYTNQVEDADGEPTEIEDEIWYSAELHLTLLARHSDPRIGVLQTIGVSGLRREEPPASLLDVPQGCRFLDVPAAAAPAQESTPPKAQAGPGEDSPS